MFLQWWHGNLSSYIVWEFSSSDNWVKISGEEDGVQNVMLWLGALMYLWVNICHYCHQICSYALFLCCKSPGSGISYIGGTSNAFPCCLASFCSDQIWPLLFLFSVLTFACTFLITYSLTLRSVNHYAAYIWLYSDSKWPMLYLWPKKQFCVTRRRLLRCIPMIDISGSWETFFSCLFLWKA